MIFPNRRVFAAMSCGLCALLALPAHAQKFTVTKLVSDGFVPATTVDPSLINPWGVSFAPGGPFWVSDNNSGVSTLYSGSGGKISLTVSIPPPAGKTGSGTPTGQVYNGSTGFQVTSGGKTGSAVFIFATEDGTISGWAPSVNATAAILAVDHSSIGAVYKGLTIVTTSKTSYLYAANFRAGDVEMYNEKFNLVTTFTDPGLPAGYAPYNVQFIAPNSLYVTFARQDAAKHDSVSGPGFGYIDIFGLGGRLMHRVVSRGQLNAPWGLDIAPAGFGPYAGDLLVGNFGNGRINVYHPVTGVFVATLLGANGMPIVYGDLWALINGNGGSGGDAKSVYFTAGLKDEAHGLLGSLSPVPAP